MSRTELVKLRVTPQQKQAWAESAEKAGVKLSEWIRQQVEGGAVNRWTGQEINQGGDADGSTRSEAGRTRLHETPGPPAGKSDVAECRVDDVAPEITFEQRVEQLHNQGKTRSLARKMATEEGLEPK